MMKISIHSGKARWRPGVLSLLAVLLLAVGSVAGDNKSFLAGIKEGEAKLDGQPQVEVAPVTQPTVIAGEDYQGGAFRVLARKGEINRFRCGSCHNGQPVAANNARNLTHGDVVVNHGREGNALACIDCHHPEDRDALEDKKGNKIDFDHSYQLCGQCHFRQKRDWLGGAHGKRVSFWAGERVVYNCTTCHNPHSPRFPARFPATYAVPQK